MGQQNTGKRRRCADVDATHLNVSPSSGRGSELGRELVCCRKVPRRCCSMARLLGTSFMHLENVRSTEYMRDMQRVSLQTGNHRDVLEQKAERYLDQLAALRKM